MLESVAKRSEFVYTREKRYTKVIYYYYWQNNLTTTTKTQSCVTICTRHKNPNDELLRLSRTQTNAKQCLTAESHVLADCTSWLPDINNFIIISSSNSTTKNPSGCPCCQAMMAAIRHRRPWNVMPPLKPFQQPGKLKVCRPHKE